jgi:molybdopterin synthase sulfur carrier subunit
MKEVEVRLYASLRKYHPGPESSRALVIKLSDKANLGDLLGELKIPKEEIAITMVNGRSEQEGYLLQADDRIGLFPLIGGG